jgi:hypothetical protein
VTAPIDNVYLQLTRELNAGRLRAIICSGQAVVLHRLAVMSKDGDWILREDQEALDHALSVLGRHGARYRFGAPLDVRWLRGGWSSHLEFRQGEQRVRTDFFSRPPRLSPADLERIWREQEGRDPPFLGVRDLIEQKKSLRARDHFVLGELARHLVDPRERILESRSPEDLITLAQQHPGLMAELVPRRPLLGLIHAGERRLVIALAEEQLDLVAADRRRIEAYERAAEPWAASWLAIERNLAGLPLREAHRVMVQRAETVLPFQVTQP